VDEARWMRVANRESENALTTGPASRGACRG
jgi:hypothetical protein